MTELLAGRYERVASLGRGAMGEVWLANDRILGRQVAVKRILTDATAGLDHHAVERIVREARVAARVQHPNVVAVFDLITEDGQPYVIMEYVRGQTLAERIRQRGRLGPDELLPVVAGLADALETAHRAGIVHRDIKPANVMIDEIGRAKLADFGIARGLGDGSLTETGSVLGTIAYMAPEVARGGEPSPASDIYSLGATIFAAAEGYAPHVVPGGRTNTAAMLVRRVTEPAPEPEHAGVLTDLVAEMLASDATQRPTAGEIHRRAGGLLAAKRRPTANSLMPIEPASGGTDETEASWDDPEPAEVTRRRGAAPSTSEPAVPAAADAAPQQPAAPGHGDESDHQDSDQTRRRSELLDAPPPDLSVTTEHVSGSETNAVPPEVATPNDTMPRHKLTSSEATAPSDAETDGDDLTQDATRVALPSPNRQPEVPTEAARPSNDSRRTRNVLIAAAVVALVGGAVGGSLAASGSGRRHTAESGAGSTAPLAATTAGAHRGSPPSPAPGAAPRCSATPGKIQLEWASAGTSTTPSTAWNVSLDGGISKTYPDAYITTIVKNDGAIHHFTVRAIAADGNKSAPSTFACKALATVVSGHTSLVNNEPVKGYPAVILHRATWQVIGSYLQVRVTLSAAKPSRSFVTFFFDTDHNANTGAGGFGCPAVPGSDSNFGEDLFAELDPLSESGYAATGAYCKNGSKSVGVDELSYSPATKSVTLVLSLKKFRHAANYMSMVIRAGSRSTPNSSGTFLSVMWGSNEPGSPYPKIRLHR